MARAGARKNRGRHREPECSPHGQRTVDKLQDQHIKPVDGRRLGYAEYGAEVGNSRNDGPLVREIASLIQVAPGTTIYHDQEATEKKLL